MLLMQSCSVELCLSNSSVTFGGFLVLVWTKVLRVLVFSLNFLEWRDYMLHYDDVESNMLLRSDEK